jgi:hypothetical protein
MVVLLLKQASLEYAYIITKLILLVIGPATEIGPVPGYSNSSDLTGFYPRGASSDEIRGNLSGL